MDLKENPEKIKPISYQKNSSFCRISQNCIVCRCALRPSWIETEHICSSWRFNRWTSSSDIRISAEYYCDNMLDKIFQSTNFQSYDLWSCKFSWKYFLKQLYRINLLWNAFQILVNVEFYLIVGTFSQNAIHVSEKSHRKSQNLQMRFAFAVTFYSGESPKTI
jgi:hypothetical protein